MDEANHQEEKRRIRPVIVESDSEVPKIPEESTPEVEAPKASKEEPKKEEVEKPEVKIVDPPQLRQPADFSHGESEKSNKLTFILVTILVALFVAFLAGGIYVYTTGTKSEPSSTPTSTFVPEPTEVPDGSPQASASPKSKADYSKYKVSILNGSGKIGEAGRAKALLEKEGFKVSNTANAKTFDFAETVIQTKSNVPEDVVAKIEESLADSYETKTGEELASSDSFDVVITVGSK